MPKSPRELALSAFNGTMTDDACEQFGMPYGSSFGATLILSLLERGLRGDARSAEIFLSLLGNSVDDDGDTDELSAALFALLEPIAAELEGKRSDLSKSVE